MARVTPSHYLHPTPNFPHPLPPSPNAPDHSSYLHCHQPTSFSLLSPGPGRAPSFPPSSVKVTRPPCSSILLLFLLSPPSSQPPTKLSQLFSVASPLPSSLSQALISLHGVSKPTCLPSCPFEYQTNNERLRTFDVPSVSLNPEINNRKHTKSNHFENKIRSRSSNSPSLYLVRPFKESVFYFLCNTQVRHRLQSNQISFLFGGDSVIIDSVGFAW